MNKRGLIKLNSSFVFSTKAISISILFSLFTTAIFAANTMSATTASATTTSTVTGYGTVTASNHATLTAVGICYNTASTPTTANSVVSPGAGTLNVQFSGNLTGLTSGQRYYLRAYCTNGTPTTFYGTQVIIYTLHTITTGSASSIAATSVSMSGNITSAGANAVSTRGFVYSTSSGPTLLNGATISTGGTAYGAYSHTLSSLTGNTTYYVKAYVTDPSGVTTYGTETSFTTAPTITTGTATPLVTSATVAGTIAVEGSATISARGIVYSTSTGPTLANSYTTGGTTNGAYTHTLTGLSASTTYYAKAYVTNAGGTYYGAQVSFTTNPVPPTVSYATLPFSDSFTSGSLSSNWATSLTTGSYGVIAPMDETSSSLTSRFDGTYVSSGTYPGSNGLAVYNTSSDVSGSKQNLFLGLNLLNKTGVSIGSMITDWGTGSPTSDQLIVYISVNGGLSWGTTTSTIALNLAPYGDGYWNSWSVDVSALATSNSMTLSATTMLKMVFNLENVGTPSNPKSGQFIYMDNFTSTNTGTLPVEMTEFSVVKEDNGNNVLWSTVTEINNDYFEVERSDDGINFYAVGKINGQGTTYGITNYEFLDVKSFEGIVYYRLKQVDFDGKTSYSKMVSIQKIQSVKLYKYSENSLLLNGENCTGIRVFDLTGKLVLSSTLNSNASTQLVTLDYSILANEIYVVQVTVGKETVSQKLVF